MLEISSEYLINSTNKTQFQLVVEVKNRHLQELVGLGGIQGVRLATTTDGEHIIEIYTRTATLGKLPQDLEGISVRPIVIDKILH